MALERRDMVAVSGNPFRDLIPSGPVQEANPHRIGACPECGAYRTDGRPPYIHKDGCPHEGDLQMERWLAEQQTGDHGGPVLYCTEHDHVIRAVETGLKPMLQPGVRSGVG